MVGSPPLLMLVLALANAAPAAPTGAAEGRAAYELSLAVDAPLLASTAALFGAALLLRETDAPTLVPPSRSSIWGIDRGAVGRVNGAQSSASTLLQDALVVGAPAAVLLAEWDGAGPGLAPGVVVVESILASSGLNQLVKAVVHRPRPYAYLEAKASGDALRSFYSGHTTVSFAAVTSATVVLHALHPDSVAPLWLGGFGLAAATSVAVLRVTSGEHFPTDVAVGALTGLAIGWLVPELHRRPRSWGVTVGPGAVALHGGW